MGVMPNNRILELMEPKDRADRAGRAGRTAAQTPTRGALRLEREHQRVVANYCHLEDLPFIWHATNARSRATIGTPDFIIGLRRGTLWLEMKLPGQKLSADQEVFRAVLRAQGITLHIAYSDDEAIKLIKSFR